MAADLAEDSRGWWVLSGDALMGMLCRVADGADPAEVYAAEEANCDREYRPEKSYEEAHDRISAGNLGEVREIAHVLVNERRYLMEECLDALIEWLVRDLVWPVDFAKGGEMFPASCRGALLDAWARWDGGDDHDGQRAFIEEEAGWTR